MRKKRIGAVSATALTVGLVASACGGHSAASNGGASSGYNAALTSIVNPDNGVGGTLNLETAGSFDNLDPGMTYYANTWDLYRLWDRTMMGFANQPGAAGLKVVGDLAQGCQGSQQNTVWTCTLRSGAKYSNGDTIKPDDVAYAIERTLDTSGLVSGGPTYFSSLIKGADGYPGPFVDKNPADHPSGIAVDDGANTITFTLNKPFADFDYLMTLPQTSPIERSHEQGSGYQTHISADLFTGQYEVQTYNPNGGSLVLVPNPGFDPSTDPDSLHVRHASKIDIRLAVDPVAVDENLIQGSSGIDVGGGGVQSATQNEILGNPQLTANADSAPSGAETFLSINTQVEPFKMTSADLQCRQAVEWAVNKAEIQAVSGGEKGGGDIASTVLPTNNSGYRPYNLYDTGGSEGDANRAQQLANSCRDNDPNFTNSFQLATFQPDDPGGAKLDAEAQVVAQNLDAIGFNVSVHLYEGDTISGVTPPWTTEVGSQSYAETHHIGLFLWGWAADFPTGYGYMDQLLTGDGIRPTGSSDLSYWDDSQFRSLLDQALSATSPAISDGFYAQADQYAIQKAVLVPLLYQNDLLFRPPSTTNVMITEAYGEYNYATLGAPSTNQ